ncbi:M56 family metallopeptidase [Phenylobacterium aquaticum]|uniref:M56 family metallopeptidase n=1 Tax=Phenylobacterium aquaticum TaxID=1763816 RepID=UPI001F5D5CC3|nr:M56 family metallopeptidase [Phenylobacterium aquaticum]MCI3132190.1 peptidase M56 [Phenylobacterium aquaticum]
MGTELFADFLWANAQAGLAILAVLALRRPVRRLFGAQTAYALWAAVPLVLLAGMVPAAEAERGTAMAAHAVAPALRLHPPQALIWIWAAGLVMAAGLMALGQMRFLARARRGQAGPAVVGVITPRLVTPADFQTTYTDAERALIRAHERAHIERDDPKANALVALAQCLCWFNPLVHAAAYAVRLDQELACDATVMATRSRQRRLYAQTMLKTQLSGTPLPLGCHWLAGAHPLEARIAALARPPLADARLQAGAWGATVLVAMAAYGVWAAKPPAPPRTHFEQAALDSARTALPGQGIVMIHLSALEVASLPQPRVR